MTTRPSPFAEAIPVFRVNDLHFPSCNNLSTGWIESLDAWRLSSLAQHLRPSDLKHSSTGQDTVPASGRDIQKYWHTSPWRPRHKYLRRNFGHRSWGAIKRESRLCHSADPRAERKRWKSIGKGDRSWSHRRSDSRMARQAGGTVEEDEESNFPFSSAPLLAGSLRIQRNGDEFSSWVDLRLPVSDDYCVTLWRRTSKAWKVLQKALLTLDLL